MIQCNASLPLTPYSQVFLATVWECGDLTKMRAQVLPAAAVVAEHRKADCVKAVKKLNDPLLQTPTPPKTKWKSSNPKRWSLQTTLSLLMRCSRIDLCRIVAASKLERDNELRSYLLLKVFFLGSSRRTFTTRVIRLECTNAPCPGYLS